MPRPASALTWCERFRAASRGPSGRRCCDSDVGGLGRAIAIVAGFSSAPIGYIVGMAVAITISEAEPPPKALKNQAR
jgi:hypothetical protein